MSISANFPAIKPTLLLDFANTKQLDPRITFTRASTATYYDGKTTAMAEQNLVLYSQQFDNSFWVKTSATVTADSTTAPDGTTTADTITGTAGAYTQYLLISNPTTVGISSAVTNTYSVYLKAGTISSVRIYIYNNSGGASIYGTFDLTAITGVAGSGGGASTPTVTIVDAGNSWRRVTVTGSLGGSAGQVAVPVIYADNGNFYAWGFQAEQRSSVTTYTATTTQAITNYIPVLQTAASGVARFDNNPTTDESLGLLIEESRTNLLTYSSQFDNASWGKSNVSVTADTIVAPDGTLTGDKLVENSTTNSHNISQSIVISSGASYTVSVYAKAAERTQIQLQYFDGTTNKSPVFSLVDGTKVTDGGIGTAWTSTNVGNGWWRFSITATSAATTGYVYIYPASGGTAVYTGNGFSGIYIWGAQVEAGAFATSYIPTVASTVTRAADAASMTGTNFSSWYNAGEGTVYTEASSISPGSSTAIYSITDSLASISNAILGRMHTDQKMRVFVSGTSVANLGNSAETANTFSKFAGAYKVDDFALSNNASAVTGSNIDTSGTLPVVSNLSIGNAGSGYLNGRIKKLSYYPLRVTNANLQALTS